MEDERTRIAHGRIRPGTRLNDTYEIDRLIGSGGMGEIYRGHAIHTGDAVAIKLIRPDMESNEVALGLFQREAAALNHLYNEAIVRYYVFSIDPVVRRHYLAMEFVDGPSLSQLLERGPLDYDSVQALRRRVASALQMAHERSIIHRDVSPDNIIMPGGDISRAKIIDFGIARSTAPGKGVIIGTPRGEGTIIGTGFAGKYNYVSPEQLGLAGGEVTAKSDIYSFGLVLAEALTGKALDMGGREADVKEKRRSVPNLDAVDARMRPLIVSMLDPDPAGRPTSMAAVANWSGGGELPPLLASFARNKGKPRAEAKRSPKRKSNVARRVSGSVALAVVLGGGALVAYSLLPPQPVPPPVTDTERITRYVSQFQGGPCFYAAAVRLDKKSAGVEAFARTNEAFDAFYAAFTNAIGYEPDLTQQKVYSTQCPAVDFLHRAAADGQPAPVIDLRNISLRTGQLLSGEIRGYGTSKVALLQIQEDGVVRNVSRNAKDDGDAQLFDVPMVRRVNGGPFPEMLVLVTSPQSLNAFEPATPTAADAFFDNVAAEASSKNLKLGVAAKMFLLRE
jgi:serine/threonine-protein kinase